MSNSASAETAAPRHGYLHILGLPGSGRSTLYDALQENIRSAPHSRAGLDVRWSSTADAERLDWVMCAAATRSIPIWTCNANQDIAALEVQLKIFVQCLLAAMYEGGEDCGVGGNPVF